MASKRMRSNGSWELQIRMKDLLPKPVYLTFDTEVEADRYKAYVEGMLEKGVVPPELAGGKLQTLGHIIDLYEASVTLSESDKELIPLVRREVTGTRLAVFNYQWVESWVESMKKEPLAPSTLVKRVGVLARCIDWAMRSDRLALSNNPLRLLPKGYGSKGRAEAWSGERSRRLSQAEEWALRRVITDKNELLLFEMSLETGMRLREMFTLTVVQIDMVQSTIFLDKTKNGSKRQVPMSSVIKQKLEDHLKELPEGSMYVFPWWVGGDLAELRKVGQRLSHRFAYRVRQAGLKDLKFHDARHEATSRFFEKTKMTDLEIASITGHKDPRMLKRYANLRGSSLASKLW